MLNGWDVAFVNSTKYLSVIFDKKMTWRLHIETTEHSLEYIPYSKVSD
jgi:hypothetical protein